MRCPTTSTRTDTCKARQNVPSSTAMKTKRKESRIPVLAVADLSTAHLTAFDRLLIGNPETRGISMSGECGALVYLPIDPADIAARAAAGYSAAFLRIVRRAMRQRLTHLRFDADGAVVKGLPKFD